MQSSIPFFMVPNAPITMGISSDFIFHILYISIFRPLYLLFFARLLLLLLLLLLASSLSFLLMRPFSLSPLFLSSLMGPRCSG